MDRSPPFIGLGGCAFCVYAGGMINAASRIVETPTGPRALCASHAAQTSRVPPQVVKATRRRDALPDGAPVAQLDLFNAKVV